MCDGYDIRFGRPVGASNPEQENNQAAEEIYEQWMQPVREVCKTGLKLGEDVADGAAALRAGTLWGQKAARDHCAEIDRAYRKSLSLGHYDAARHHLKRETKFAIWTLGFDDCTTKKLVLELHRLNGVIATPIRY
ncbi:MAG TPA: hypothetical protein V6D17_24720 [Candidatus Obscuribacterales bacterium]